MRKMLLSLTLAGAALIAPGLTPAAHAGGFGWFSIGAGFRVGPLSLSFVLGQPFAGYAPAYYYRAYAPIAYPGYHCTSRCFIDHGVYYHDRACPVIHHYFAAYQIDPYDAYLRYAPRYGSYFDGGYYERHGGYYGGGYGGSYGGGYGYNGYNGGYGSYNGYYNNYGYYDRGYSYRGFDRDRRFDRDDRRFDRDDRRFDRDRRFDHDRDDHRFDRDRRSDRDRDDRRHDRDHDHNGDHDRHHGDYDRH